MQTALWLAIVLFALLLVALASMLIEWISAGVL